MVGYILIYIRIHMWIHIHICAHGHTRIYIHTWIHIQTYIYLQANLGQAVAGDNEAKLMTKLEWVRTSDPVIRSPARYRWTTAPATSDHL